MYAASEEIKVEFKDGLKSYSKSERVNKVFSLEHVLSHQKNGPSDVLNLKKYDSTIFEALRSTTNNDENPISINLNEFISCGMLLEDLLWDEEDPDGQKVYKKLCDSIQGNLKDLVNDTKNCSMYDGLLYFTLINSGDFISNVFVVAEPVTKIFESSEVKDYDQLSAFFRQNHVHEFRISNDLLSEDVIDGLSTCKGITKLVIMSESGKILSLPSNFGNLKNIKSLVLGNKCEMNQIACNISMLRELKYFKVETDSAENEDLQHLINNEKLTVFEFNYHAFNGNPLREVSKYKSLEILHLRGNGSFAFIDGFKEMPNLTELKIRCIDLRQDIYEIFKLMPKLKVLDVEGMTLYEDFGKSIQNLTKLEELNVNDTGIDTKNFNQITEVVSLKRLYMDNSCVEAGNWENISKLINLEILSIVNADLNENERFAIKNLPNLEKKASENYYGSFFPRENDFRYFDEFDSDTFEKIKSMVEDAKIGPGISFTVKIIFSPSNYKEPISQYFKEIDSETYGKIGSMLEVANCRPGEKFTVKLNFD